MDIIDKITILEMGPRQKFAFMAVKEILQSGLKKAKVSITKPGEKLKFKMPDEKQSPTSRGSTGLEFEVDVEALN
jgi:hypothetical protein